MTYRPRIGITMDVRPSDEGLKSLALPVDYAHSILNAGGLPMLLACTRDLDARIQFVESLDGLLIPGGGDIDPKLYGQPLHPQTHLIPIDRQDFDLAMLALAQQRQLPTLGICMGCQTMNVQRQGTLHQHLPELQAATAGSPILQHRRTGDRHNTHEVVICRGSRLAAVMGLERLAVNSRHHQGIDRIGKGLVATALAPDGLVEALEDPSLDFWMAVQWHPENLPGTPHERLFKALVVAARAYRDRRAAGAPPSDAGISQELR